MSRACTALWEAPLTEHIKTTSRRPVTRAAILAGALLLAPHAAHAEGVSLWAAGGVGYRHSFGLDAGGLSLAGYLGFEFRWFGLEYETQWSNDHTLKVDERVAGRNTNWLNVLFVPVQREHLRLMLDVGPGLGWIKPPGKVSAPSREMSWGVHEHVRLDFGLGGDELGVFVGIRLGAMHLWQESIAPSPEHGFDAMFIIGIGPGMR